MHLILCMNIFWNEHQPILLLDRLVVSKVRSSQNKLKIKILFLFDVTWSFCQINLFMKGK